MAANNQNSSQHNHAKMKISSILNHDDGEAQPPKHPQHPPSPKLSVPIKYFPPSIMEPRQFYEPIETPFDLGRPSLPLLKSLPQCTEPKWIHDKLPDENEMGAARTLAHIKNSEAEKNKQAVSTSSRAGTTNPSPSGFGSFHSKPLFTRKRNGAQYVSRKATSAASTNTMDRRKKKQQQRDDLRFGARQMNRNRTNGIDASVNRYTESINAAVGGPPADDEPREVWDAYLKKFMGEKRRRDTEDIDRSWPQLAKANKLIENMRKTPFKPVGNSGSENDQLRGLGAATSSQQKGQLEENRAAEIEDASDFYVGSRSTRQTSYVGRNEQNATLTDTQAAAVMQELAIGSLPSNTMTAGYLAYNPPTPSTTNESEDQDDERPKKKRRSGAETLESDLGKNWEAQVDAEGHRPARGVRKP